MVLVIMQGPCIKPCPDVSGVSSRKGRRDPAVEGGEVARNQP